MSPRFSVEQLAALLAASDNTSRFWIAFSGGCDSTVLLHAVARCRDRLPAVSAVHVDHGLNPASLSWARHCQEVCDKLGVPLRRLTVDARPAAGASPEAAAREARYAAIGELMRAGEVLLTAHHRDDQAETLLLQLLRGAGPRGLAAMPERAPFARGTLMRPLLGFSRAELAAWAGQQGLDWIEDPSNAEHSPDRNFLRHQVLPLLRQRWPSADLTLARAADHQAEAAQLLQQLGLRDLEQVEAHGGIDLTSMATLSLPRQRGLIRAWLHRLGLRAPPSAVLERVFTELAPAQADRNPCVTWADGELRRYRGHLYVLPGRQPLPDPGPRSWDLTRALAFGGGWLTARPVVGQGLSAHACRPGVTIAPRAGGERCRPLHDPHHRRIKTLIREAGIPPWLRRQHPLVWVDEQLVQVVGLCLAHDWAARPGEDGVLIQYQSDMPPAPTPDTKVDQQDSPRAARGHSAE